MPGLPGRTEKEAGLGCSQWLEEATEGPRARKGDVMRQEGGGWPGQLQRAWLMVSVGDLLLGTTISKHRSFATLLCKCYYVCTPCVLSFTFPIFF